MMIENGYEDALKFDCSLKAGASVEARWTDSHRYHFAKAVIVRVNEKSLRVRLEEGKDGYKAGQEIVIPRPLDFKKHSMSNCAVPLSNGFAGPEHTRGTTVPGKGKVTKIYQTWHGWTYDFDPNYG